MNTPTSHGLRSATKTTKLTKSTKTYLFFVVFVAFVFFVSERVPSAVTAQQPQTPPAQPQTQAQQRPVFRGGTHFVRVDAYPTAPDGKIIEGLKPEDFEIFEDGKAQAIESFDFVKFEGFTPDVERRDPSSQREGFDMAADPRYRVFVIYVDIVNSKSPGAVVANEDIMHIRQPLVNFLDRIMTRGDLYGFLTSRNSVKDLVLAQKTDVTSAAILDVWRAKFIDRDESDEVLDGCGFQEATLEGLKTIRRVDQSYSTIEDLVRTLGSIRQERKSIILASNVLTRARIPLQLMNATAGQMPRAGITTGGKVGIGNSEWPGAANGVGCTSEVQRLAGMDFDVRYHDLLKNARQQNVAFYPITPAGLQAPVTPAAMDYVKQTLDDLRSLASETDGIAIVGTNDLNAGLKRIADDLAAYYILGYYTTNTNFNGALRNIRVRHKGKNIRARREYRAPTREEIDLLARGNVPANAATVSAAAAGAVKRETPIETALVMLERASRPFAAYVASKGNALTVVAELSSASITAGKWKEGADVDIEAVGANGEPMGQAKARLEPGTFSVAVPLEVKASPARVNVRLNGPGGKSDDWVKLEPPSGTLVGDPVVYRAAARVAMRPVAGLEFARNERVHVEWPVLGAPLDRREVRLLDKTGKPFPVDLPLSEDPTKNAIVVDMSVSGLGRGDYLIELTAGRGQTVEKRLVAIRIRQ